VLIELFGEGFYDGSFAGAWRTVEEEIGDVIFVDEFFDWDMGMGTCVDYLLVGDYVGESFWTVFLDPWYAL
jgi:hypothetical protein